MFDSIWLGFIAVAVLVGIALWFANRTSKNDITSQVPSPKEVPRKIKIIKNDGDKYFSINECLTNYNYANHSGSDINDLDVSIGNPNNKHQELLRQNWKYLCQNTSNLPVLLNHFFQSGLVSQHEMDLIESCSTTIDRYTTMYKHIFTRIDENNFEKLIEALNATNNEHVANTLLPDQIKSILGSFERLGHIKESASDVCDALIGNGTTDYALLYQTYRQLENGVLHPYFTDQPSDSVFYDNNQQSDENISQIISKQLGSYIIEARKNSAGQVEMIKIIGKENQQVTPNEIIGVIVRHSNTIEELVLDKICLKGTHFSQRLILPKLRKFSFHRYVENYHLGSQTEINHFYSNVDRYIFDMIFFRKYAQYEDSNDLKALIPYLADLDVDIVVRGMVILRLNQTKIVSGLESSNILLGELLKKESQCESISLTNPHGKVSGMNLLFPCLKRLLIYEVTIDDIQSFFNQSQLEELRICSPSVEQLDVFDLPKTLKEFSCMGAKFAGNTKIFLKKGKVYFSELNSIALYNCTYSDEIIYDFNNIFQPSDVCISFCGGGDNEKYLLHTILDHNKSNCVYIRNFPKEYHTNTLQSIGIAKDAQHFILERLSRPDWCVLDNNVSFERREELFFYIFQLHKLWCYQVYHRKKFFARRPSELSNM